jgi:hypothetical protein
MSEQPKPEQKPPSPAAAVGAPASMEFERAFSSGTVGPVRDCDCGRTCWDGENDDYDWDAGEREHLEAETLAHPEKFVRLPYGVGTTDVDGRSFVAGCPCNGAGPYERWIIRHAVAIADFLNARARLLAKEAAATTVDSPNTPDDRTGGPTT